MWVRLTPALGVFGVPNTTHIRKTLVSNIPALRFAIGWATPDCVFT